ncbi:MAG TPA: hypothetical protein VNA20_06630 [Frankiaceae bacterium]|nr:hypothetical protein [Frankiaceae bacterium]
MRTFRTALAAVVLAAVAPAATPTATATRTDDVGLASSNVTYQKTIPVDAGLATGARLHGKYLYVAGSKAFSIYDVSDPLNPALQSVTPVGFNFPSEDVDTNGAILLLNDEQGAVGELQVWDVRDKKLPTRLATLPNIRDHTFTCVHGCRWAYGSRGSIVDLRVPAKPRLAGSWGSIARNDGFDVTEVSPGLILTSTRTLRLLDARKNPLKPKVLRTGGTRDNRLIHSNRWPRQGRDKFFLVQGETPFSGRCTENSGAIMAWDAKKMRMAGEYRIGNGTWADGKPAAGPTGCTAMWFQQHPSFRDGGLIASAFFEHGVRFLNVAKSGAISEVGYYMPAAGSTIASYWITPDVVYAIDLEKGIDILSFDGSKPPAQAPARPPAASVTTTIRFAAPAYRDRVWCQLPL